MNKGIRSAGILCSMATSWALGNGVNETALASFIGEGMAEKVLGHPKYGPECERTMERVQKDLRAAYQEHLRADGSGWKEDSDLNAADSALASAVKSGLPLSSTMVARATLAQGDTQSLLLTDLLDALGNARPDFFGPDKIGTLTCGYAEAALRAGLTAAFANPAFRADNVPDLVALAAETVGEISIQQGEVLDIVRRLEARGDLAEIDVSRSELLGLLKDILYQNPDPTRIAPALRAAGDRLTGTKNELVRLRDLTYDEPDLAPLLDRAQTALSRADHIELADVEKALAAADEILRSSTLKKRRDRVRLLEARPSTAAARQRFLSAAGLYAKAAEECPSDDEEVRAKMWYEEGELAYEHGLLYPGLSSLDRARAAYQKALTIYTEVATPANWANTQNNLGNALSALGGHSTGETGLKSLSDAMSAFRAALRVYTKEETPAD